MATTTEFRLDRKDKATLKRWLRTTTLAHGLGVRANILLALDRGDTPTQISETFGVTRRTVYKWKDRYLSDGLDGLKDQPRPGRPSKINDKAVKKVLSLSQKYTPEESTQWSIRLMAKHADITEWQVRQIWKAFDIKPHLSKTFKISNDPAFAEKVIDIIGLYMNPLTNAVVLSLDENTQIQALDRTQPGLPLSPGHVGSHTHDYKRNGTAALYAAFNIATGKVIGQVTNRSRSKEFLSFLRKVNRSVAKDKELHIIVSDASSTVLHYPHDT
jgi:transposase